MVVGKDGMVVSRPVETGPLVGNLRIIRNGLKAGDAVVVSNYQAAIPGSRVQTKAGKIAAEQPATSPREPAAQAAAQATLVN